MTTEQQTKKVKFSLIKAQKYLDKLRKYFKNPKAKSSFRSGSDGYTPKSTVALSQVTSVTVEYDDAKSELFKLIGNAEKELDSRLNIGKDLKELKELVYTTNATVGLSKLLSEMERLGEERNYYETIKSSYETSNSLYDVTYLSGLLDRYTKIGPESNDPVKNATIRVYSHKFLEDKITDYTKKIEELENKRDKLNATTDVEFEFHTESLKILGL